VDFVVVDSSSVFFCFVSLRKNIAAAKNKKRGSSLSEVQSPAKRKIKIINFFVVVIVEKLFF
jgi:hypothetical protein